MWKLCKDWDWNYDSLCFRTISFISLNNVPANKERTEFVPRTLLEPFVSVSSRNMSLIYWRSPMLSVMITITSRHWSAGATHPAPALHMSYMSSYWPNIFRCGSVCDPFYITGCDLCLCFWLNMKTLLILLFVVYWQYSLCVEASTLFASLICFMLFPVFGSRTEVFPNTSKLLFPVLH